VYADWLQDRADPRAEFVRRQVRLHTLVDSESAVDAAEWFIRMGDQLDPSWVAFMRTLAYPFEPITLQTGKPKPAHPFAGVVGNRGRIATFESQYRSADLWSEGLLADLEVLTRIKWSDDADDTGGDFSHGFLCELSSDQDLELANAIRRATGLTATERGAELHGAGPNDGPGTATQRPRDGRPTLRRVTTTD
jgi:hypothetical protein